MLLLLLLLRGLLLVVMLQRHIVRVRGGGTPRRGALLQLAQLARRVAGAYTRSLLSST
jgi:hypothetical protein